MPGPVVQDVPGRCLGYQSDAEWSAGLVAPFPVSWGGRLLSAWRRTHGADRRGANLELLKRCRAIGQAQRAGVQADANDAELCEEARQSARDTERRLALAGRLWRDAPAVVQASAVWLTGLNLLDGRGLGDAGERAMLASRSVRAFGRRLSDDRWWRRVLRRVHAHAVESTARGLGLVNKRAGCYVSEESAKRRRGQVARNARALEGTHAVNESGQDYTLAELAATGAANREIRRHELMTRIAGFELLARDLGHSALFVTVTCPPRMHAARTRPGSGVVEVNPTWDGTRPDEAQRYLSRQWARMRAAADRQGVRMYGFRIAEPNHDGTPHWHLLVFFDPVVEAGPKRKRAGRPVADRVLLCLWRRYFLEDRTSRAQRKHAVKVERIDWTRGSAAGYVAKYVAKNIDGHRVEKDLFGNDAIQASQRVEAWAATWRVRQFQQIGGAPVGIWRELRRVSPEQAAASGSERVAWAMEAVNITAAARGAASEVVEKHTAATGWAEYLRLQGGALVRRADLSVTLAKELTGECGTYGDPVPAKPCGVQVVEVVREVVPAFGAIVRPYVRARHVRMEVRSERQCWRVVPRASLPAVRASIEAAKRRDSAEREAFGPWSPVNNCTQGIDAARLFAPALRVIPKTGRVPVWAKRPESIEPGAGQSSRKHHHAYPS